MTTLETPQAPISPPNTSVETTDTDKMWTADNIIAAFATARRVLPRAALAAAVARWPEVGAPMIKMLEDVAAGAEVSEHTQSVLFFALFVMAQVREKRAFRPLCELAAKGDVLDQVLGDAITENLSCILARVFDGDWGPLRSLIEAQTATEFTREAACYALAWLTVDGQLNRDKTSEYLEALFENLQPQTENIVWLGWQGAISMLGLAHLAPLVEQAFDRGLIDRSIMSFQDFQSDLYAAQHAKDPVALIADRMMHLHAHDDAVALLSTWAAFETDEQRRAKESRYRPPVATHRPSSSPKVGRNALCPCGSGKKYKKCCLGKPG